MKPRGIRHTQTGGFVAPALNALRSNHSFRSLLLSGKACVALLSASVCLSPAFSDELGTNLTLQAALDFGVKHNPQLQASLNEWKGLGENIRVQKALPDPTLTYGYFFESVETRVGPQEQSVVLNQRLPAFGKLSAMEAIATEVANAAEQRYNNHRLALQHSIARAYAELYYLERNIAITQDRIQLVRDLERVATARYKTGAPLAPILQAQVELGRLEDRLNSLHDMREPLVASLNALLNRATDAPLSLAPTLPYLKTDLSAEDLSDSLAQTSPELRELQANIAQGEGRLKLAKRNRLPDIMFGVTYIDTADASMPVPDSGKDPIIGTVGITLPIWFGKNRAQIESAVYQRTAAQLALDNRTQTLEADIRLALFTLRDADRKINLYKQSLIPKAMQSLEVNRQSYEAGHMEFINLIDAERMLLEFELAHERALADHLTARAKLTLLTGIDFLRPDAGSGPTANRKEQP
jgi:cobalt-zinc-cadmium efflux system outer membrane protein